MGEKVGTATTTYLRGINLISKTKSSTTQYYLHNAHGDVVNLTNTSGNSTKTYSYDAFGNEKNQVASDANPFRYCGEYLDKETNEYYLRARYYDPSVGRFSQEDTIRSIPQMFPNGKEIPDPLSLNLYTYTYNNPVLYQDPSGNFIISTTILVTIGLAAVFGTAGGLLGNAIAEKNNVASDEKWKYILLGAGAGALLGIAGGYFIGPSVASASGLAGISISSTGISAELLSGNSVWALNPFDRGYVIERALGGWCNNFPTIDKAENRVDGIYQKITSIKSIDLTAKTYQVGTTLYKTIMKYANQLAKFVGHSTPEQSVSIGNTTQRVLEIAVPPGATPEQIDQIIQAIEKAKEIGVDIVFHIFQ